MMPFIRRFQAVAAAHANHPALCVDGVTAHSYHDLAQQVEALAERLEQHAIGPGCLVALELPKSADYIVAMLACWQCGAAFMPLDPSVPPLRRDAMLQQARPHARIHGARALTMEPAPAAYAPNLAYVMYTSGSSGTPKGVMVPHEGILPFLDAQIALFAMDHHSRAIFLLSTQFDASISDIGTALLAGATLCIETADRLLTAETLPKILADRSITHMDISPALLALLPPERMPASLQTVMIGGEVCADETVRRWAAHARLIVIYGPTEATVCTSMVHATPDWQTASIGYPLAGITYRVVADASPMADGMPGELYIAGDGLALGYVGAPELTAEKFVMHEGRRYYRTGDRVCRAANGEYRFLGRVDRQLKLRGQLIAPEEIEHAFLQHPAIRHAAIIVVPQGNPSRLCAYIEAREPLSRSQLKHWLEARLMGWMLPQTLVQLPAMPLTPNGKIDHHALQTLAEQPVATPAAAAENPAMAALQHIWQDALHLPGLPGLDDDFFDTLGGDSLASLAVIFEAERQGFSFSTGALHQARTIRHLLAATHTQDALSTQQLEADAVPNAALQKLLQAASRLPHATGGRLLLTGATGFLGSHLLQQLLQHGTQSIDCLVRAADADSARARIDTALQRHGLEVSDRQRQRIHAVAGDLSQPQLGLSEADWQGLVQETSEIYHCAAAVNMLQSYAQLHAANVAATRHIIALAATATRKKLHVASTLSVFVATDMPPGPCHENDWIDDGNVHGGYAQSKWVADRLVQHAQAAEMDIRLFRFGLITGDSRNGIAAAQDYLATVLRGLRHLQAMPEGPAAELELDVTPVDYAARAMLHVAQHAASGVYHVAGAGRFSLAMLAQALQQAGHTLAVMPAAQWAQQAPRDSDAIAAWMALCRLLPAESYAQFRGMDLFQATSMRFDQTHLDRALAGSSIACPAADAALLQRYLRPVLHG